jgi:flagellar hook-basal body complex protein FliE
MIRGVGQDSALAKAAIEAALRSVQSGSQRVERSAAEVGAIDVGATKPSSFAEALKDGVRQADQAARSSEQLPLDMLAGKVGDFHEVAATLKQSELMFKFSLEVRNKLIEAYRETMRMTV